MPTSAVRFCLVVKEPDLITACEQAALLIRLLLSAQIQLAATFWGKHFKAKSLGQQTLEDEAQRHPRSIIVVALARKKPLGRTLQSFRPAAAALLWLLLYRSRIRSRATR